jgi:hypothetical protein
MLITIICFCKLTLYEKICLDTGIDRHHRWIKRHFAAGLGTDVIARYNTNENNFGRDPHAIDLDNELVSDETLFTSFMSKFHFKDFH